MSEDYTISQPIRLLGGAAGVMAGLWLGEAQYVSAGGEPIMYCAGVKAVYALSLDGWYTFITYAAIVLALVAGALHGSKHSIRWLVLVVILCSLPGWLETAFSHGRWCGPPPLVGPPAAVS